MINKVLVLDDQVEHESIKELLEKLNESSDLFVKASNNFTGVNLEHLDLLIVDWDLTGSDTDGRISLGIIKRLLSNRIVPVVIYTTHSEDTVLERLEELTEKQRELVKVVRKGDLDKAVDEVKNTLENSSNLVLRISYLWKFMVNKTLENTVNSINKRLNEKAISLLMRECNLDKRELPVELSGLLADLLSSELGPLDTQLGEHLAAIGSEEITEGYTAYKWLDQMRKYTLPSSDRRIFTGDIFNFNSKYGIVITPKCDLARPGDSSKVKFLVGFELEAKFKGDESEEARKEKTENFIRNYFIDPSEKEYWLFDLPYNDKEITLIFRYDDVSTLEYKDFNEPNIVRIGNLRSPYLDDLIQNYSRYQLRIGLPSKPFVKKEKVELQAYVKAMAEDHAKRYAEKEVAATKEI